jgi:hypothetical protein
MSETRGNRQEPEDTCAQLRFAASNSFSPTTVADTARSVIEQPLRATGHNTKWQTIQPRKFIACSLKVRLQWLEALASAHLSGRARMRPRMPRDPERLPENIASRIQNIMPFCTAMEVQNKFREPGP